MEMFSNHWIRDIIFMVGLFEADSIIFLDFESDLFIVVHDAYIIGWGIPDRHPRRRFLLNSLG